MTPPLRITLFGSLRATYQGEPLRLKIPPKTKPLWAYLLLHRDQTVWRQTLAFTLWPDVSEHVARTNLRRHLYHLKQALPPDPDDIPWMLIDAQSVRWNPAADYGLDVAEFECLRAHEETLAQAVALYNDDLLVDEYDEWLLPYREHLRSHYIAALQRLICLHRQRRDYTQAIACSRRLLADEPLHEDAARQLMALRYEAGDRAGALQAYEEFLSRLRAELDTDPMPETAALHEAILGNQSLPERTEATDERPSAPAPKRQFTLPFVGREKELETINACWESAVHGQGQLLLISGEDGVGKTRLMEEFGQLVQEQGGRVLWGSAHPMESVPYQAFAEVLRAALPMLTALETDPLWLAVAAELLPEIRAQWPGGTTPLPPLPRLDPDSEHARLFEGIARCLEELARPRPLLLMLDDLHWAGAGTAHLLEFLACRAGRHPLLVVGAYRQTALPGLHPLRSARRGLQAHHLVTHLALDRLSKPAVHSLVTQIAGLGPGTDDLADPLYAASEGNAFFLAELIREQMERGDSHLPARLPPQLPTRVRDAIAVRVARLDAAAKTLAEVAAVIGPGFDADLLRQVSGWRESRVLDALDLLMDAHLVREVADGGRFDYTFTHHLIQSALYASIPEPQRQRRHHRVAHVLTELAPERWDDLAVQLALHFERGGEPQQAAGYYLQAARRAWQAYAAEETLDALARVLELTDDPDLRAEALAMQAEVQRRRGERTTSAADPAERATYEPQG